MAASGQNLKSSRRTYVFRFALKNGHRRLQPVQEVASLDLAPAKAKPSTPFSRSAGLVGNTGNGLRTSRTSVGRFTRSDCASRKI